MSRSRGNWNEVNAASLAEATRQQFERHTPVMLELGLVPLGDFRMKPPPVEVHNRFFLSPEGDKDFVWLPLEDLPEANLLPANVKQFLLGHEPARYNFTDSTR